MESIIARYSLFRSLQPFQSTLALVASGFRPLSALFIFPLSRFLSLILFTSIPFRDGCEGKDLFRIRNYTNRITKDRFRGRSAESGLRSTRVHRRRIPLLSYNLRQLPPTGGNHGNRTLTIRTCLFLSVITLEINYKINRAILIDIWRIIISSLNS